MREEIKKLRPTGIEQSVEAASLLASSIPTIGGLLSGVVMNTTSSRRWRRLLAFLEYIEGRLRGLEGLSDDQEEVVVEIVERVVRERSEEKTDCYRNILLNGLSIREIDYDKTLEMVKLVERLTVNHIKVLQVIRDPVTARSKLGSGGYVERDARPIVGLPTGQLGLFLLSSFFPNWSSSQLSRVWEELCDAHVMRRVSPQIDMPPAHEMIGMDLVVSSFHQYVSEYGHDFIRYVLALEADQTL